MDVRVEKIRKEIGKSKTAGGKARYSKSVKQFAVDFGNRYVQRRCTCGECIRTAPASLKPISGGLHSVEFAVVIESYQNGSEQFVE